MKMEISYNTTKKPFLAKLIPEKAWKKWPLYKFANHKSQLTAPIDTGRILLKGIQAVDRRTLQTKGIFSDKSDGGRLRSDSASTNARGANREKEKAGRKEEDFHAPRVSMIPEDDGNREQSEDSQNSKDAAGDAWAQVGPPVE